MQKFSIVFLFTIVLIAIFSLSPVFSADFDTVKGWSALDMNMEAEDAKEALDGAGISYNEEMFMKEGLIYFTIIRDDGYDGTIYFEFTEDGKDIINQILFQSPYMKTEEEANKEVEAMEAKYGPPHEVKDGYSDDTSSSVFYLWKNENTVLTITLTHYFPEDNWTVWEEYSLP